MAKYFTYQDRFKIEFLLKKKVPKKEIAKELGKHYTAVYREIKRGTVALMDKELRKVPTYCADYGQKKQDEAGHNKGRRVKLGRDYRTAKKIEQLVKEEKYSPYAVSQELRYDKACMYLCTNTIYTYIDRGYVNLTNADLPHGKEPRKKKAEPPRRPSLKNIGAVMIDERPKEIGKRERYGDWEMDTVYSGKDKGKACLLVLTERKSREEVVVKMPDRTSASTQEAIDALEKKYGTLGFREKFRTITVDNGVEFSNWKALERSRISKVASRTKLYFCHPYCSSERGSNENANRLIRRHIRKGEDISQYTEAQIERIQEWINTYPRRLFGGMSSYEYRRTYCSEYG